MNLYLSSYRLGNHPEILQDLCGNHKNAAIITNARDYSTEHGVQRELDEIGSLGFMAEELDLKYYFDRPQDLNEKLKQYDLIWAVGGNSFLLRQAMFKSGFDDALKSRLVDDNFVYGGYSAGIVVLCPTLEGIELVDPINVKPISYESQLIWRGLGILDYSIAPHYDSDHPESEAINNVVDYFKKHSLPYKTLRDGEVILVKGGVESLVI